MKKNIFYLLIFLCGYHTIQSFDTINEVQTIAHNLEEYPDGTYDWYNPDYTAFHKTLVPSFWQQLIHFFSGNYDTAHTFKQTLDTYLKSHNTHKENSIGLLASNSADLYIWSNLHGAFHSLVRDLHWLHTQNKIDNQLNITNKNTFFIFNGDAISRSPYTIETLTLILSLIIKNPHNVLYIRGNHEHNELWKSFSLKEELQIRVGYKGNGPIPFEKEIDTVFKTLPLALYIHNTDNPNSLIRISHFKRNTPLIDENIVKQLIPHDQPNVITIATLNSEERKNQKSKKINIPAFITSEDWKSIQRVKNGLRLLEQDRGSITWGSFSSPIPVHQQYANFMYDAFVKLHIDNPIGKSNIQLINRHVKKDTDFIQNESLNILSGMPLSNAAHFSEKPNLMLGSSMSLMQGVPVMGKRTKQGLMARINKENLEKGGVHGRIIRADVRNDDYTPSHARKNIKQFLENNIDITLLQIGSPTLQSYLDLIRNNNIAALFPITGGPLFHAQDLKNIVHFRATYADEVYALIDYVHTELGARKFALFYQDDAYGKGPLQAAHKAFEQHGITDWIDVPYSRASSNLTEQANKIKEAQPDAIGLFSAAQPTQELIRQMGIDTIANKKLFGITFLGEESFRQFIQRYGIPVVLGAVVPNPAVSDLEIVQEYRTQMDTYEYSYDVFSLEAYITTSILIEVINMINGPITKETVVKKLQSLDNFQYKGLNLTYNPNRNDLNKYVYLETGPDQKWKRKEVQPSIG